MNEDKSGIKKERKIQIILIVVLICISLIAVIGLTYSFDANEKESFGKIISVIYSGISPRNVSNLINASEDIIIIDVRECKCNYNKGHLIDAVWDINPQNYYNTTSDLLVYDNWQDICIDFCEKLVNNTYGSIYYLEGGINEWKNVGLPTIKEN